MRIPYGSKFSGRGYLYFVVGDIDAHGAEVKGIEELVKRAADYLDLIGFKDADYGPIVYELILAVRTPKAARKAAKLLAEAGFPVKQNI